MRSRSAFDVIGQDGQPIVSARAAPWRPIMPIGRAVTATSTSVHALQSIVRSFRHGSFVTAPLHDTPRSTHVPAKRA